MRPLLFLLFLAAAEAAVGARPSRIAYISILSTDDFLLPAKVMAHRLRNLNDSIPFLILATEDVSNATIETLISRDVTVLQMSKIDTPFAETHPGAKYQYTKIRLWSLTDYDVLFHLDLDTLPIHDPSPVFSCGSFCASFRHSDKFNAGVFVMKPNLTVYRSLLEQSSKLSSYDGGDQGFFNTYFGDLKYAPMFNDFGEQKYEADMMRLSAAYNYDIGMYYMNGGQRLVQPKIVHYTLGPAKPWSWWTYPIFDLNQDWLDARLEMEAFYGEADPDKVLILYGLLFGAVLIAVRELLFFLVRNRLRVDLLPHWEVVLMPYVTVLSALFLAAKLTPSFCHPVASWMFFSATGVSLSLWSIEVWLWLRLGIPRPLLQLFCSAALALSLIGSSWTFLAMMPHFGSRAVLTFPVIAANLLFLVQLTKTLIQPYHQLPFSKHCLY